MSRRATRIAISVGLLTALAGIGALTMSWMMKQPLYRLGDVVSGRNLSAPLVPPRQTDPSSWQVEKDIRLTFESVGEGRPILVVHGGPAMPYENPWAGLSAFKDRRKLLYYHQRGCGDSTRPFDKFDGSFYENMTALERTLGLGAQIADVERIRQILNVDKITIVGHSFGGFIAALYAAEFPDRVDQLVLVAPAGVLTPPDERRDIFKLTREKLSRDLLPSYDEAVREYLDFGSVFSRDESQIIESHRKVGSYLMKAMDYETKGLGAAKPGGWTAVAMYFSIGRAQDYRPALSRIKADTLILVGAEDHLGKAGSESYRAIPNSSFTVIERGIGEERAGHFIFDECPNSFERALTEFLN